MQEMSAEDWVELARGVAQMSVEVFSPPYRPTAAAQHMFANDLRAGKAIAALLFRNEHGTGIALNAHRGAPQPTFTLVAPPERRCIGAVWERVLTARFPQATFEYIRSDHPISLGSALRDTGTYANGSEHSRASCG
ncbi:hypothetical protein HYV74_02820 [Candidatus Uhrbacteria bacterium]|nr:hypothetical protein [Candidatus Uhrbacteria bacterium]